MASSEEKRPAQKKIIEGVVVSDKMDKTVVVQTERKLRHPLYKRVIRRRAKVYAHDEQGIAKTGSRVRLIEARPLSKTKRWQVLEVLA
ncbi:MAG: 30S ribosomal protein S17 [Nitrospirae bacterium]|nr:30S ribosomal protein S17 [Nitrospirota bacterium]